MDILNEGIDCKGKKYKRRDIGTVKDITGKEYTYLTAQFRVEAARNSWLCSCRCGNLRVVQVNHLEDGTTKSCGCYGKEVAHRRATIDRVGEVYGELTVKNRVFLSGKKGAYWNCLCSCGKYTIVQDENLTSGNTKSCGHLRTQIEDLTGNDYGYWHVLGMAPRTDHHIKWTCLCRCGVIKDVRGDWLKSGDSQSCGCKNSSRGADKIEAILTDENIQFKKEYCFPDLKSPKGAALRFDFVVFDNNLLKYLIEFDGELHYQSRKDFGGEEGLKYRQLCDGIKNDFCLKNNIPLYRIPYYDQNIASVEDILSKKYLIS